MKRHREYIREQIKKNPKFADDLAEADREVAIAVELAKLRERRGLSQTQLAQLAGMKQPQVARLESGAYFPAIGTLIRLLAALGGKIEIGPNECRVIPITRKVAVLR
jgi:predicted transcriptional regulator